MYQKQGSPTFLPSPSPLSLPFYLMHFLVFRIILSLQTLCSTCFTLASNSKLPLTISSELILYGGATSVERGYTLPVFLPSLQFYPLLFDPFLPFLSYAFLGPSLTLMHCVQVALVNSKEKAEGCKKNTNPNIEITKGNKRHAILFDTLNTPLTALIELVLQYSFSARDCPSNAHMTPILLALSLASLPLITPRSHCLLQFNFLMFLEAPKIK